jgi:hypothetical protein
MPNISEFKTPQLGIRPSEIGVEATAAAGRRAGAFFNQAGEAMQTMGGRIGRAVGGLGAVAEHHIETQEISRGAPLFMGVIDDQSKKWNERAKGDPRDESIRGQYLEQDLEPALQKFQEGFITERGKRWAEQRADAFRTHMYTKTDADMASRAADAAHMDVNKAVNTGVNTLSQGDPTNLPAVRGTFRSSIDEIVNRPNLSPAQRSKIGTDFTFQGEKELVHAAITGVIMKGGDWRKLADDPENAPFIKRQEIEQFEKAQKAVERRDKIEQKTLDDFNKKTMDHAVANAVNNIYANNVSIDERGNYTIKPGTTKALFDLHTQFPQMTKEAQSELSTRINWIEQKVNRKEAAISDQATKQSLYDGLFDAKNPTTNIALMRAQVEGKLNKQDFNDLLKLYTALYEKPFRGPYYTAMMDAVKSKLGTHIMADGPERYASFVQKFMPAYAAMDDNARAGAFRFEDKNSLVNQAMEGIKPTPQQLLVGAAQKRYGLRPETMNPETGGAVTRATPEARASQATGVKPTTVRQNGFVYTLQPDGTYKGVKEKKDETPQVPRSQ